MIIKTRKTTYYVTEIIKKKGWVEVVYRELPKPKVRHENALR